MKDNGKGSESASLRYEEVARHISEMICGGTLRIGDRIPSVRQLSRQRHVSITTALHAYRLLENQGWIEARPQSGYYVIRSQQSEIPEPTVPQFDLDVTTVEVKELIRQFYALSQVPGIIQMGAAVGAPGNFPSRALARTLSRVARDFQQEGNSYDLPPGNRWLRTQIARRAMESGCHLTPDDIVITTGCTEALNLCLRALTKPGDVVLIESPTYHTTLQIIESLGLRALEIPTHPRHGIELTTLEYVLEREAIAACLLMPGMHNPLGCSMSQNDLVQLVELLRKHEVPLIEDDVWGEIYFGSSRPLTAKGFDKSGNVLLCSSFSKSLAPGYRVGWVAPGRYFKEVEYLKLVGSLANPTLPSLAIAEFLENGGYDHHLRGLRRETAQRVSHCAEAIERYFPANTRMTRPQGGEFLWVELPEAVNTTQLFTRALAAGICIAPGAMFSAQGKFNNYLRLYCTYHETEVLESAIRQLGGVISAVE
jgi:DNA-binding transcriptional MocR family regulator